MARSVTCGHTNHLSGASCCTDLTLSLPEIKHPLVDVLMYLFFFPHHYEYKFVLYGEPFRIQKDDVFV